MGQDKQVKTPVLLVCVFNRNGTILAHDLYFRVFSPYGLIRKILIFDKAKVWKTFVEYSTTAEAKSALASLDGTPLLEDGSRMCIFSSKLHKLNFQQQNSSGVDYSLFDKKTAIRSRAATSQNHQTVRPRRLTEENFEENYESLSKEFMSTTLGLIDDDFRELVYEQQWKQPWQQSEQEQQSEQQQQKQSQEKSLNPETYIPQKFIEENQQSKVLYVRSLDKEFLYEDILFQIFYCFGNIRRIVLIPEKASALIEFQHLQDALQAKEIVSLVKNFARVFYSNYQNLSTRKGPKRDRIFKYKLNQQARTSYNSISNILHFSGVPDSKISALVKRVNELSGVRKVKYQGKEMGLLQMQSSKEAMYVLGRLQGVSLGTCKLNFSFTRSKI